METKAEKSRRAYYERSGREVPGRDRICKVCGMPFVIRQNGAKNEVCSESCARKFYRRNANKTPSRSSEYRRKWRTSIAGKRAYARQLIKQKKGPFVKQCRLCAETIVVTHPSACRYCYECSVTMDMLRIRKHRKSTRHRMPDGYIRARMRSRIPSLRGMPISKEMVDEFRINLLLKREKRQAPKPAPINLSRTCAQCGEAFLARNGRQLTCSSACYAKSQLMKPVERHCLICGISFLSAIGKKRCCSTACSKKNTRRMAKKKLTLSVVKYKMRKSNKVMEQISAKEIPDDLALAHRGIMLVKRKLKEMSNEDSK